MWAAIKLFFSSNTARLIEIVSALAIGAVAVIAVFQAGKRSEKTDELRTTLKNKEVADDIETENRATLRDGDAADKLRDNWSS